MACDKCGRDVPMNNDVTGLLAFAHNNPGIILAYKSRHLLPVYENGTKVCEGSPSNAQYLEGQPRDTRGFVYRPEHEQRYRDAYLELQKEAEQVPAGSSNKTSDHAEQ